MGLVQEKMRTLRGWPLGLFGLLLGCAPPFVAPLVDFAPEEVRRILARSELGPPPPDTTNRVADDPVARRLGQALFYETKISPIEVSCKSCHPPELGFQAGSVQVSPAIERHVPTLWNVGHMRWFLWDGHADTLWAQVRGPLESPVEMASDRLFFAHAIHDDPRLREAYEHLFGPLPDLDDETRFPPRGRPTSDEGDPLGQAWAEMAEADREAVNVVLANASKAIAAYERQIVSGPTPFDTFARGLEEGDAEALSALNEREQQGLKLFVGKARCFLCHTGPLFSDREFHNIGLGPRPESELDMGRILGVDRVLRDPFNALGPYSDDTEGEQAEKIRFLTATREQEGQFKTPGLRNVALTAPYMHDGRFETLEEVVRHYSELGQTPPFGHTEDTLLPLDLSDDEVAALVAFLESLTNDALPEELVGVPEGPLLP